MDANTRRQYAREAAREAAAAAGAAEQAADPTGGQTGETAQHAIAAASDHLRGAVVAAEKAAGGA